MRTILRIDNAGVKRDLGANDLPVALTLSPEGRFELDTNADPSPAAWLAESGGKIFLQAESKPCPLLLNGSALEESEWLNDGDSLELGGTLIRIVRSGDVLELIAASGGSSPQAAADATSTSAVPTGPIQALAVQRPRRFWLVMALLGFLAAGGVFVVVASPVRITTVPVADSLSLRGGLAIPFFGRYFSLPGAYAVEATKKGYKPLQQQITVAYGSSPEFSYTLTELPGYLDVLSAPVESATVTVDGRPVGRTPLRALALEAGQYKLAVAADGYLPISQNVTIVGKGDAQRIDFALIPAGNLFTIASEPAGARVLFDGQDAGITPAQVRTTSGTHQVELSKPGWKPYATSLKIAPNGATQLPAFKLEKLPVAPPSESTARTARTPTASAPASAAPTLTKEDKREGILEITTSPPGADISIDGEARGSSPITVIIAAGSEHEVLATRVGFQPVSRQIQIDGGSRKPLHIDFEVQYGIVFLDTRPAGATLRIDGQPSGSASQRLRLTAEPHALEISKPGYAPYTTNITPSPAISKSVEVSLERIGEPEPGQAPGAARTPAGQALRLIDVGKVVKFQMGASRREAGRRSNEMRYWVELTHSFYLSEKEVTNREYRFFNASHNSGTNDASDLNGTEMPVVGIGWDEAAKYLNWLSSQEGLPPAYREVSGKMVAVVPPTAGYRMPTEAEWTFAAQYEGGHRSADKPLKYPWGEQMPPPQNGGNYADDTASGKLPMIIKGYSDGHAAASPVGKYPPNKAGIFDLGGNASEWIHDYYDVHTGSSDAVLRDPMGPASGAHHVVRGASWRHGGITELRLSYRDYAERPRNDLGLRIARYVTAPKN